MRQKIYCSGSLLEAVQRANVFPDCKHFVDMPMKKDTETTLSKWEELRGAGEVDQEALKMFILEHFDDPGCELEEHIPQDFDPKGHNFEEIKDVHYREWARHLHSKWPLLCRKVSPTVLADPHRFSLIALPHPFVVPGGRFREMYYWDSFFTIKGLLASKMYDTVKGMIFNMQYLINEFGFVPNGNRVYYLNRSQPPLLTWCVHAYYTATKDVHFVEELLPTLMKEFAFFNENRSVKVEGCDVALFRYRVTAKGPRPESYREDVESAVHINDDEGKCRLWGDIAAAAESGRDFSSRWFEHEGPMAGVMGSTRTSDIIPVDLNAIIAGNMRIMRDLYNVVGDKEKSEWAGRMFDDLRHAIHTILWNEEHGCWFDYDIARKKHIAMYFDTNFFPLFAQCAHGDLAASRVAEYLSQAGALAYPGGLPSSLIPSGQQWDFPNAWAPTTWVVVEGLRLGGQEELAFAIVDKWIRRNHSMWKASGGRMFEKYNVVSGCARAAAGGGEYEVQEGFGWTNGVILDFLLSFGSRLSFTPDDQSCPCCASTEECRIQ